MTRMLEISDLFQIEIFHSWTQGSYLMDLTQNAGLIILQIRIVLLGDKAPAATMT